MRQILWYVHAVPALDILHLHHEPSGEYACPTSAPALFTTGADTGWWVWEDMQWVVSESIRRLRETVLLDGKNCYHIPGWCVRIQANLPLPLRNLASVHPNSPKKTETTSCQPRTA